MKDSPISQQVSGTHPTGMHSCYVQISGGLINKGLSFVVTSFITYTSNKTNFLKVGVIWSASTVNLL